MWADTILKDMNMAKELVQDLFVTLWEKDIDRQLENKGVRACLYTAVRNKAVRTLKGDTAGGFCMRPPLLPFPVREPTWSFLFYCFFTNVAFLYSDGEQPAYSLK